MKSAAVEARSPRDCSARLMGERGRHVEVNLISCTLHKLIRGYLVGKTIQHLEGVDQLEKAAGVLLRLLRAEIGGLGVMDKGETVAFLMDEARRYEREGSATAAGFLREWAEDLNGVAGVVRNSSRLVN